MIVLPDGRSVGRDAPCYIIAEAGVNHNGDPDTALRLVDVAAEAGADAVKFQTFRAKELATADAPTAAYQRASGAESQSQQAMLGQLELAASEYRRIRDHCVDRGIVFLSTPFDADSADLLEDLEVPLLKIPSGELTNLPFLTHVAGKGRPMVVSTGMAWLGEVEEALRVIEESGAPDVVLLHCVSSYPAAPEQMNLRAMDTLHAAFGTAVGLSDHTLGIEISLAAVARGACIVEKHFTLDQTMEGPDHHASLEPDDLKAMIAGIRKVEAALGDGRKRPTREEEGTASVARRSVVTARRLTAGSILKENTLTLRRPGNGLSPRLLPQLLGRRLRRDLDEGHVLQLDDLG